MIDQLARFALAAIDGAFVVARSDRAVKLTQVLGPLPDALDAARRQRQGEARVTTSRPAPPSTRPPAPPHRSALGRKLTALRAMATQTSGPIDASNPETFTALVAEEAFTDAAAVRDSTRTVAWLCPPSSRDVVHRRSAETGVSGRAAAASHSASAAADDAVIACETPDPATARARGLFRRRHPDWERWRLSAYYARSPEEVDDLAADQLERSPNSCGIVWRRCWTLASRSFPPSGRRTSPSPSPATSRRAGPARTGRSRPASQPVPMCRDALRR